MSMSWIVTVQRAQKLTILNEITMSLFLRSVLLGTLLVPATIFSQSVLTGPGGTFEINALGGVDQPGAFLPIGSSVNTLFVNYLYVQTDPFFGPEDVYYDGLLNDLTETADSIMMSYSLFDVDVDLTFRKSTPGDGPLSGTTLSDYFIMDIEIFNMTDAELDVIVANLWDFDLDEFDPTVDMIDLTDGGSYVTYMQTSTSAPYDIYASASLPVGYEADDFDTLADKLAFGPLGSLSSDVPSGVIQDWALVFEKGFTLPVDGSATMKMAFGAAVIPEPSSAAFLFGFGMIGYLVGTRRKV
jgi:hypothetical protein